MYILMMICNLFANDNLQLEKENIATLNKSLDNSNYWVYNQSDLISGIVLNQYAASDNLFLALISHENKTLLKTHKKQLSNLLLVMSVNGLVSYCRRSYSYIVIYDDNIDIDFFKKNADKEINGGFYYKSRNTSANMFFIDSSKNIDDNALLNFYLNNCKFEI